MTCKHGLDREIVDCLQCEADNAAPTPSTRFEELFDEAAEQGEHMDDEACLRYVANQLQRENAALQARLEGQNDLLENNAKDMADAEILAIVVRTGCAPPNREWHDDVLRKSTIRAFELHERAEQAEALLREVEAQTIERCAKVCEKETVKYIARQREADRAADLARRT